MIGKINNPSKVLTLMSFMVQSEEIGPFFEFQKLSHFQNKVKWKNLSDENEPFE